MTSPEPGASLADPAVPPADADVDVDNGPVSPQAVSAPEAAPAREAAAPGGASPGVPPSPSPTGRRPRPAPGPSRPEQSREDTDADWGEYPESARDRLYRDRPPHWADY